MNEEQLNEAYNNAILKVLSIITDIDVKLIESYDTIEKLNKLKTALQAQLKEIKEFYNILK
jgi:hypothetical protein